LHGIGKHDGCARANDVLARIALSERANDKVRNLSGGQMRRVEIARALLHRPRLLVLDEPTVGLDIKSRADILGYVRRLVVEDGVSVLWASHLIDEVSADDDVIVLHQGRIPAHGSVSRIMEAADAQDIRTAFTRLTQGADAAAQTRTVSVAGIRLDSRKSVQPFKGIFCDGLCAPCLLRPYSLPETITRGRLLLS
jgi:ABC-2 type transport system ATP-binding protein